MNNKDKIILFCLLQVKDREDIVNQLQLATSKELKAKAKAKIKILEIVKESENLYFSAQKLIKLVFSLLIK